MQIQHRTEVLRLAGNLTTQHDPALSENGAAPPKGGGLVPLKGKGKKGGVPPSKTYGGPGVPRKSQRAKPDYEYRKEHAAATGWTSEEASPEVHRYSSN